MKRVSVLIAITLLMLLLSGCQSANTKPSTTTKVNKSFTSTFTVNKRDLTTTGRNPFFILEPGYTLLLEGKDEGKPASEKTEVLNQTKLVDGVQTRVVKETHMIENEIVEISFNYFAIDKISNSVFYFGERTDNYENGKVVDHEGSWISGEKDARFGLIMPGTQLLGGKYMQEIAPGVAFDQAETENLNATIKTPAGDFKDCLKTKETTPFEPDVVEFKYYKEGIGKIADADLKLVKHGFLKKTQ